MTSAARALAGGIDSFRQELTKNLNGKPQIVDTVICGILANGHLLIEDVPGVGKTTFIKIIAKLLGLEVSRVQFTSDLLPADILGVEVYNEGANKFQLHRGPIFTNILVADELNRANPRTQSALLEAMGEGFVSIDRTTHPLPRPFIVFASQNPSVNIGTYEIPESQLDRFAAKISLGYPEQSQEQTIFKLSERDPLQSVVGPVITPSQLEHFQALVDKVTVSDSVVTYAYRIVEASRRSPKLKLGVSTRGGVIWMRMAKARAVLDHRDYLIPDDLQELADSCLSHRLQPHSGVNSSELVKELLRSVPV
jgi:MoxR-like ATPase